MAMLKWIDKELSFSVYLESRNNMRWDLISSYTSINGLVLAFTIYPLKLLHMLFSIDFDFTNVSIKEWQKTWGFFSKKNSYASIDSFFKS